MNEEPELEVQAEQVQAQETNPKPEQGKTVASRHHPWLLFWINIFMLTMIMH
jgi:hypothetical protein